MEGERLAAGRWNWLCKGVEQPYIRSVMATLAENQFRHGAPKGEIGSSPLNENLTEATLSTNIYGVNQILLPVIRRIYPYLMANNWVSIQPMLSPVSLIFYLRYFFNGTKSNTQAGDEYLRVPLTGDLGFDPFYSSARNVVSATSTTALESAVNAAGAGTRGFDRFTPLNASVFVRAYASGSLLSEVQFQGVYGSATTIPATPTRGLQATALVGATYNSVSEALASTPTVSGADRYEVQWTYDQELAGDFNSASNGIPEMDIRIKTDAVQAEERKLKTQWTLEAAEDLKVLQNVDAEKELVNVMAAEILGEIDREILKDLIDFAAHRTNHDFTDDTGNNTKGNIIDRNQALAMKVRYLSSQIHKTTRVAEANFMVTSPTVAARFEELRGYVPIEVGDNTQMTYGIQASGYLPAGKIKVFKDPLFPDDLILIGYKGRTFLDSGYFYCPYIPIKTTPIIYDPNTLQPKRGMITRYGTKMVDAGEFFYGTVFVSNIIGHP